MNIPKWLQKELDEAGLSLSIETSLHNYDSDKPFILRHVDSGLVFGYFSGMNKVQSHLKAIKAAQANDRDSFYLALRQSDD